MRERVDALGVSEPELQRSGARPDRGQPAGRRRTPSAPPSRSARRPSCTSTTGSEHPRRGLQDQPGRRSTAASSRSPGSTTRSSARRSAPRGDRQQQHRPPGRATTRSTRTRKQPLEQRASPRRTRRRCASDLDDAGAAPSAEVLEVPEGILVAARRGPPADQTSSAGQVRPLVGDPGQPGLSAARTSRTRSRTSTSSGGNEPIVTFDFTDKGRKAFQDDHARGSPSAAPTTRIPAATPTRAELAALRDRARQRARLDAVHQLPREPGRHRRLDRRPDLRRLHDPERAGPREDPQDRRAADAARADLALAGLGDARQAGARPGPDGGHRRLR